MLCMLLLLCISRTLVRYEPVIQRLAVVPSETRPTSPRTAILGCKPTNVGHIVAAPARHLSLAPATARTHTRAPSCSWNPYPVYCNGTPSQHNSKVLVDSLVR